MRNGKIEAKGKMMHCFCTRPDVDCEKCSVRIAKDNLGKEFWIEENQSCDSEEHN